MAPLQHPRGRTPELCPSHWQRSAAGPPKNTYSGSHRGSFAQGLPKNEFSLGTHQAGRVPTWSLYNTHGLPPLSFDPFLGYTGGIPLLSHSQNGPNPSLLYPQSPYKTSFPRVPTYPHGPSTTRVIMRTELPTKCFVPLQKLRVRLFT